MTFQLRDYQVEACEAVVEAWDRGIQRPAIVLATGLGKTVVMAQLVADCVTAGTCKPVILVHRDELVRQTVDKLLPHAIENGYTVGVIQAAKHEVDAEIVVASVQTLTRRLGHGKKSVPANRFDLIITDECHHAAAESYLRIYDHFGGRDEGPRAGRAKMLGVTATLARGDGVPLGHVWQEVCFERDIVFGIAEGRLVKPRSYTAQIEGLDLDGVRNQHGDYSDSDLGARMIKAGAPIAQAILQYGRKADGTLRRGITFAPTVACAQGWVNDFNAAGIVSKLVVGDTEHDIRQAIYRATHSGVIDMIVSVMCLTEGFDLPAVELAVIGRPTKKLPLYIQMVGRVLRPSELTEKEDAVILDITGLNGHKLPRCMADLDLPDPCECGDGCTCTWRYLCMGHCQCPLDESDEDAPERPVLHVDECAHRCRVGAPWDDGIHLPPEIDEADIDLIEVDPYADVVIDVRRRNHRWLETHQGVPFLAGNKSANPLTVFLWPQPGDSDADTLWQVGSYGDTGRAARHGEPVAFPLAAQAAVRLYGPKPRPLVGAISDGQLSMLAGFGHENLGGLTKAEASDLISIEVASRRIHG